MIHIQENVDLQMYSAMRLKATARFLCEPETLEDVVEAIQWAKDRNVPFRIIGDGTNVYFKPFFDGLIICPKLLGLKKVGGTEHHSAAWPNVTSGLYAAGKTAYEDWEVFAGENWDDFVGFCVDNGLYGLENLSLIPGTVGAAPVQNIGAYGAEVKSCVRSVQCFDLETFEEVTLSNEDCHFAYRSSIFNTTHKNKYFIISVTFRLWKHFTPILSYPALAPLKEQEHITAQDVRNAVIQIRSTKLPDYRVIGNNGSFFKNTLVDQETFMQFVEKYPDYPAQFRDLYTSDKARASEHRKILTGWLIERSGAIAIQHEHFALHDKSKLIIVHKSGQGNYDDLMAFVSAIKQTVFDMFGLEITSEPECI